MSTHMIGADGMDNGGCLAFMCFYDACTRNWRAQEKRFGNGQMKMVEKVDDPDQLVSYLEVGKTTS
jgi:hypothetical protein